MQPTRVNIQGHRGARGLYPENTIVAFIEAVKLGADTLEMDLVISADRQVVVSHEAWMNADFCSQPNGLPVEADMREKYNLYRMSYEEIKRFDCGKRGNPEFPMQKKMPAYKPLFSEVVLAVEAFTRHNQLNPVALNLEIKSEGAPEIFNPPAKIFIDLVYEQIVKYKLETRVNVQSFDVKMLQQMHQKDPEMSIGLLIENSEPMEVNLDRLGFIPQFYSPEYQLVDESLVAKVHQKNMKLSTWTVNETTQMEKLILMGTDGIITDYPDRAIHLISTLTKK